jgi:hypothetical protein
MAPGEYTPDTPPMLPGGSGLPSGFEAPGDMRQHVPGVVSTQRPRSAFSLRGRQEAVWGLKLIKQVSHLSPCPFPRRLRHDV